MDKQNPNPSGSSGQTIYGITNWDGHEKTKQAQRKVLCEKHLAQHPELQHLPKAAVNEPCEECAKK